MSEAKTPRNVHLKIVKEKHEQLPAIMKEAVIECWIVFTRETAQISEPVMDIVVGGDVVWHSAFVFTNIKGEFKKTAIVGNYDVNAEKDKGIWDEVLGYKEGISAILKE
ncbi:MAG: hypothetical protein ACTSQ0_10200, partial [Candidatus Heimdallarchaeota archaeon]